MNPRPQDKAVRVHYWKMILYTTSSIIFSVACFLRFLINYCKVSNQLRSLKQSRINPTDVMDSDYCLHFNSYTDNLIWV